MNLTTFRLEGLKCQSEVIRVIDGDTIIVNIPLNFYNLINHKIEKKREKKMYNIAKISYNEEHEINDELLKNMTITISLKCRISDNLDAYESNTKEGKEATKILNEIIPSGSIINCEFLKNDPYGRTLISIKYDETQTLSEYLIKNYPNNFRTYQERLNEKHKNQI